MVIRHLSDMVIDVFTGNGWVNWSRFEIVNMKGKKSLKLIKGFPMEKSNFQTLYTEVNK